MPQGTTVNTKVVGFTGWPNSRGISLIFMAQPI